MKQGVTWHTTVTDARADAANAMFYAICSRGKDLQSANPQKCAHGQEHIALVSNGVWMFAPGTAEVRHTNEA